MSAVGQTLGAVTIVATKLVKVATMVGIVASGILLAAAAMQVVIPTSATAELLIGPGLAFAASVAGWHVADWVEGRLRDNLNPDVRIQEQARLQQMQAMLR